MVASGNSTRVFRPDALRAIERSAGRHRRFGRALLLSMGSAALIGGIVEAAAFEPCTGECWFQPRTAAGAFVEGAVASGIVIGIPVGTVWGLVARPERWERVR